MKRLAKFTVGAAIVAAVFAFSPLIRPALSSAPAAFRDLLASATDIGVADAEAGAVPGEPDPEAPAGANASGIPARPADAALMTVDFVHDGDTLFLVPVEGGSESNRVKVRLIGLDTPEIGDHAECYGAEATEQLRALLPEGAQVGVTADIEALDQYGRSLFYLWTEDGSFVNYELVASGAAVSLFYAPNYAYADVIRTAEDAARSSGVGLWSACSF